MRLIRMHSAINVHLEPGAGRVVVRPRHCPLRYATGIYEDAVAAGGG
jgi:hypothetical protein